MPRKARPSGIPEDRRCPFPCHTSRQWFSGDSPSASHVPNEHAVPGRTVGQGKVRRNASSGLSSAKTSSYQERWKKSGPDIERVGSPRNPHTSPDMRCEYPCRQGAPHIVRRRGQTHQASLRLPMESATAFRPDSRRSRRCSYISLFVSCPNHTPGNPSAQPQMDTTDQ